MYKLKIYNFTRNGGMKIVVAIIFIVILILIGLGTEKLFNWTIISSLVIYALLDGISGFINIILENRLEDDIKLHLCDSSICDNFEEDFFTYENENVSEENLNKAYKKLNSLKDKYDCENKEKGKSQKFPIVIASDFKKIEIADNPDKKYELPDIIKNHSEEIFAIHKTSKLFNQLNIRVDKFENKGESLILHTSRTTYFDSLVTNRAMDFNLYDNVSIRSLFFYGPYLIKLEDSKLSNHLGFNGLVESSDGYIPLVYRDRKKSIAKGKFGASVSASFKTKYALKSYEDHLNIGGLLESIEKEIEDELGISGIKIKKENLVAAYRDCIEGGKPQLLIYVKTDKSREEIQDAFNKKNKLNKKSRNFFTMDGKRLSWISKEDFKKSFLFDKGMVIDGKFYPSTAVTVGTIGYLIKNTDKYDNEQRKIN